MIQTEPKHESFLARCWPVLLIGAAWIWIFWPMIVGKNVVGFRDSAYLYYPLFKWIDAQWAAGQIPLWNPYCNFGMPVVADGTSSVFYPGKLVFFCRFLSYPARYGIYLAIHIPIAAAGTYWFAKTLRANRAGATLAAFSFAFGGCVLFQVTNVIYLVSAAWLPFALCCVWKMVKTGEYKWAVAAGVCCALMILGGDPQMVYHVGLIAAATIAGEFFRRRRRCFRTRSKVKPGPFRWLVGASTRLALMIVVTSSLAAIQLLPTFVWAQHSERTHPQSAANFYMLEAKLWEANDWQDETRNDKLSRLVRRQSLRQMPYTYSGIDKNRARIQESAFHLVENPAGTVEHSYQFSQPPWSMIELLWPNFSGKPFPRNQRWASSLPGADRVWVPSLYNGVFVLLLGVMGIRLWGRKRQRVWLTRIMLFFCIASFGWYGAVWLINEILASPKQISSLGPQVGGVYWVMNILLPKYFVFRYPAKLFVIASLGLSLLAGISLRRVTLKKLTVLAFVVIGMSGCGVCIWENFFDSMFSSMNWVDPLFGPFDKLGAVGSLYDSFFQPVFVVTIVWFFAWAIRSTSEYRRTHRPPVLIAIVVVTAAEVLFANHWLVPQVDSSVFESETAVQRRLFELKMATHDAAPIQVFRNSLITVEPEDWATHSSNDRLSEIVYWQRESLFPKHHLGEEVVLFGSFSSIWPRIYQRDLDRILRDVYRTRRLTGPLAEPQFRGILSADLANDAILRRDAIEYSQIPPVAWNAELVPEEADLLTYDFDTRNDQRTVSSRITEFECNRFVAQVSTKRPRWLAFMRIADTGWKATVKNLANNETRSVEVVADPDYEILFIAIEERGEFEVEFTYSPIEFWVGAWVSGCSWALLGTGIVVIIFQNRNSRR